MMDPSSLFPRFLTLRDLAAHEGRALAEEASAAERAAIAQALDLQGVNRLRAEARLSREGREGWRLEGRILVEAVQSCVVTLEPVPALLDEPFLRRYEPGARRDEAELLIDPEAEDPPEPLGAGIDFGAVALETLTLALDPYPRAEGAVFEPARAAPEGVEPMTDEAAKPFAGLAALKSRLGDG